MTPQTGNVGTQVILSITYPSPQSQGNYKILWSQTQFFSSVETKVLKEGVITNGAVSVNAQITVPESRYGNHYIQFRPDNGSYPVNFQFGVFPKLQIQPASVLGGSVISLSGNGFPSNDTITLKLGSQFLDKYFSTNETGSFAGQLVIPALPAGKYELTALTQLITLSSSIALEILPAPSKNEDKTQVPNTNISVPTYDNTRINVPREPEQKTIPAPIAKSTTSASEWIGTIGPQPVTVQWVPVEGETGVTYTIEINENNDFSPGRLIRESGLTTTSYTAVLEPGIYYWRIKAVNQKGNESYWSYGADAIKVGELSKLIDEFITIVNNNGEIAMIIVGGLGAFIVLIAILSTINSLTKPTTKPTKK